MLFACTSHLLLFIIVANIIFFFNILSMKKTKHLNTYNFKNESYAFYKKKYSSTKVHYKIMCIYLSSLFQKIYKKTIKNGETQPDKQVREIL